MFDRVKVPPDKSSGDNFPLSPSWWSLLSSTAISNTDLFWTFWIFGTNNPCWVSMATPILWEPWKIYTNKCSVQSSENGQSICLQESWFPFYDLKMYRLSTSCKIFFFRVLNSTFTTQLTLKVRFSHSASTELLSTGKCNKAMDVALINNGINDSFTPLAWNDSLLWFLNLEERKKVCGHKIIIVPYDYETTY